MPEAVRSLRRSLRRIKPLHAMWMRIRAEREARSAFSRPAAPPILIYQMGKVGSTTVYKSLSGAALPNSILHLHFLSEDLAKYRKKLKQEGAGPPPYHVFLAEAVRKALAGNSLSPIKIISLIRDPIACVVSNLFQNLYSARDAVMTGDVIGPEKARRYLYRELADPNTFRYTNEWFDRELKRVFDIDVFAQPFPVDVGHTVYRKAHAEALIIRLEDLSRRGATAIAQFLSLRKPLILRPGNVREKTKEAEIYRRVLEEILLDPALCREIYSSRLVKHFYSEPLVEQFISRWARSA